MKWIGEVRCPTCKARSAMRVHRNGFMQRNILGHLGVYPWKCGECGTLFLYRCRGHRVRQIGSTDGSGGDGRKRNRST